MVYATTPTTKSIDITSYDQFMLVCVSVTGLLPYGQWCRQWYQAVNGVRHHTYHKVHRYNQLRPADLRVSLLEDYSLTAGDADNDMKQSMVYATTPTTKSIDITSYVQLTSMCVSITGLLPNGQWCGQWYETVDGVRHHTHHQVDRYNQLRPVYLNVCFCFRITPSRPVMRTMIWSSQWCTPPHPPPSR